MFRLDQSANRNAFTVGHWTNTAAKTGCTVIVFEQSAPHGRRCTGGAPGTRETDLLGPGNAGSIGRCDRALRGQRLRTWRRRRRDGGARAAGRGVATPGGPVPIVPAAVIFDLGVGESGLADHPTTGLRASKPGRDRRSFDGGLSAPEPARRPANSSAPNLRPRRFRLRLCRSNGGRRRPRADRRQRRRGGRRS